MSEVSKSMNMTDGTIVSEIYDGKNLFRIKNSNGLYYVTIIPDGEKERMCTKEEMKKAMEMLQKAEKTKEQDIIMSHLETLKNLINNNELGSEEDIKNYIEIYYKDLSLEAQEQLKSSALGYLNDRQKEGEEKTVTSEEVIKIKNFKDYIIELMRSIKKEDDKRSIAVSFNVKTPISSNPYCQIKLEGAKDERLQEYAFSSFDMSEELKTYLIEPVIEEAVRQSELEEKEKKQSDVSFGYRSDLNLKTKNNTYVNLSNFDTNYIDKLNTNLVSLNNEEKLTDSYERDGAINNSIAKKENKLKNQSPSKDAVLKRVLKNPNVSEGFSKTYMIYAIVAFFTSVVVLLQVLLTK